MGSAKDDPLSPQRVPEGWQPIATAPEAEFVFVWLPNYGECVATKTTDYHGPVWWAQGRQEIVYPTHWRPRFKSPQQEAEARSRPSSLSLSGEPLRERLRFQPPPGPPDPPPSHATVTVCPNGHPLFWITNRHAVCDASRTALCVAWELREGQDGRRRLVEVTDPSARAYAYAVQAAVGFALPAPPAIPREEK